MADRGFRAPYLRSNADTIHAVRESGFLYDSSQALAWDVPQEVESAEYRHVLAFYGALPAAEYLCLLRLQAGLVRVPYCLPHRSSHAKV